MILKVKLLLLCFIVGKDILCEWISIYIYIYIYIYFFFFSFFHFKQIEKYKTLNFH